MRFIDRLRCARGFSMIELLIAATLCSVGTIATIGVIDVSRSISVKSEKRDAMAHYGERELERLMELPWLAFAHAEYPTNSPTPPGNPTTAITGQMYAYDRTNPGLTEPLVRSVNGQVPHVSTAWDDGQARFSGRVYRFVTRIDANSRRVTIVVTVDGRESPVNIVMSSIKTRPIV